jgi:hypothetical protein
MPWQRLRTHASICKSFLIKIFKFCTDAPHCCSYRVKDGTKIVAGIYDLLLKPSSHRSVFKSKWPSNFARPPQGSLSKINVFWDQRCLQSGKKWEDGFIEALSSSVVFVPFLCEDSIKKWKDLPSGSDANPNHYFSDKTVDNFLLECILALELNSRLTSDKDTADVVFACKRIVPIFIESINQKMLSEKVAIPTISKAEAILRRLNVLAENDTIERFLIYIHAPAQRPGSFITIFCRYSPSMVLDKLFAFQGFFLARYQDINSNVQMQETAYQAVVDTIQQSCKEVILSVSEFAQDFNIRHSMAHELQVWLDSNNMSHVMPVLAHHGISSMMMLSSLSVSNDVITLIAAEISAASTQSHIQSLSGLTLLIQKAKDSELSMAPSWRCARFLDYDASAKTAIFSSCAVDIMLCKKYFILLILLCGVGFSILTIFAWISQTFFPNTESYLTSSFYSNPLELLVCSISFILVGVWPLLWGGNYDQIPKNQIFKPRHILSFCFASLLLFQTIVMMLNKSLPFESFSLFNSLQCASAAKKGWLKTTLRTCVLYELLAIYGLQYLGFALWFFSLNFLQKHFVRCVVGVFCSMCIVDTVLYRIITVSEEDEDVFAAILLSNFPAIISGCAITVLAVFESMRLYSSRKAQRVRRLV